MWSVVALHQIDMMSPKGGVMMKLAADGCVRGSQVHI